MSDYCARRLGGLLTVVGMAAAIGASPAAADFGSPTQYCGGSDFQTCASVQLTSNNVGANTLVTIFVMNDGNAPSVFTGIGLIGLPSGRTITVTGGSGGHLGNWADWGTPPPNDLSGAPFPTETFGMRAPPSTVKNGLMVGESISFTFEIGGAKLTQQEIDLLGIGIHGQMGPQGCSTKLGIYGSDGNVTFNEGPYDPNCATTVIPEPTTMILLGSGLAGVAAARRRRRQGLIELDD